MSNLGPLSFSFNGTACTAHGVEVLRLPALTRPALRQETIAIPGRDGSLHLMESAYEESLVTCDCYLPYEQGRTVSTIAQISNWLKGSGWWTQSDLANRKFKAHILDELTYQVVMPGFADRLFSIPLWLEPYAYHTSNSPIAFTGTQLISNPGTAPSEPIITVLGSGDINLQLTDQNSSQTVLITGLSSEYIVLDCAARMAHKGSTNLSGIVTPVGGWPKLQPGNTLVSWSGSVQAVEITGNWRDI